MVSKALRRVLSRFGSDVPSHVTPTHIDNKPRKEPKGQCLQQSPLIHDYPNINGKCCLQAGHRGYHYDGKYGIQWDECTIAWNSEFLKLFRGIK